VGSLPAGVRATNLATAFADEPRLLEQHLARYADYQDHAFVALNTAFMEDGGFVHVPKGVILEKPIYLLFISTREDRPSVSHSRNLILIERESQATIIEGYIGLDGVAESRNSKLESRNSKLENRPASGLANFEFPVSSFGHQVYFTNAVTEIVVGEGAVVHHAKLQQESERAFHIATVQIEQERSSNVTNHSVALGGALVREDTNVVLDGEGAENLLNGLYVVAGSQHVDNHTVIDHAKPHCNSREVYKGVLDGASQGVFNGKIIVRKDAQKTDAKQSNKNLLLSEDAVINTKPQLEIYADDVKCTHGATVGQIDPDAIFYLRSRGIGLEEARSLLTYAFANDVLGRINYQPLRDKLKDALFARLAEKSEVGSQKN
jgi:Fe-S cluster assembly protein SufD